MNRPRASVTGAGGGIGMRLCRALVATHTVHGLFRSESMHSRLLRGAGGEVVLGDLANEHALATLVREADVVFHCAGKITGFSQAEFEAVNVAGTRAVARAAKAAGVRRVIFVSSIAAYGNCAPRVGDTGGIGEVRRQEFLEDIDLHQDDPDLDAYSRSKGAAERALREELAGSATAWTIVRPTCVYGPYIDSWMITPLKLLIKRQPLIFGLDGGHGRMNAVHVDDVVRGMIAAAAAPGAAGEVFNLGGEELTFREFYETLGSMAGREPVYGSTKSIRGFQELTCKLGAVVKPAAEMSRGIGMALRMSANQAAYPSAKAQRFFGYAPTVSFAEGMLDAEMALRSRVSPRGAEADGVEALGEDDDWRLHEKRQIWNCDRHYAVRPWLGAEPANVEELSRVLRRVAGKKVKALGSLHAFAPLPDTPGLAVTLRRMKRVLAVDGDLVTAEGGITIAELNRELGQRGLALPTHGSFVAQTLAGAVATGTHGGSLQHGTLADFVEQVEVVRAEGERVTFRKGEPEFGGAVVSLGLLGVTASVTVRCVPEFYLEAKTEVVSFEAFLRDFEALQRGSEFVDARWFPQIGQVEVMRMNRVAKPAGGSGGAAEAKIAAAKAPSAMQRRMVSNVFKGLLRGIGATGSAKLNASFIRKLLGTTYKAKVGRSDEILAFTDLSQGEPFPIDDLEFAVPYALSLDALRALDVHFRGGGKMPIFFPIHLRCSAAGEQWLSANYRQDVCWLELWHYPAAPQFYAEVAAVLGRFAPRYHFGKILPHQDGGKLELNLPRLPEFKALRERMDPKGALLNPYLERVLLSNRLG